MTYNGTSKEVQGQQTTAVWPETRRSQVYEGRQSFETEDAFEELIIDRALLEMIEALPRGMDFAQRITDFEQQTGIKLGALRLALEERNGRAVEELAGEISRHAITVGAVKILRLSYELQSLARCNAFDDAHRLANDLDGAFTLAQVRLRETF